MSQVHIIPILRDNYCYLVEGNNKECLIIDPGQTGPVEEAIVRLGLTPTLILNTHHHADHVAGNDYLRQRYNVPIAAPKAELMSIPHATIGLEDGNTVTQSGLSLAVIETPGHTKGHIAFHDAANKNLFAGDTLFSMGCGRLLEGTADDMWQSLQKLIALPADTRLYCGHEYTDSNGKFALHIHPVHPAITARMTEVKKLRANNMPTLPVTLDTERNTNPFLMATNRDEFADLRYQKDNFIA